VALDGIDQALIESLQNIDLDVTQAEARHLPRDPRDEFPPRRIEQNSVEEITLDSTIDVCLGK
jgi:hypothetical protein